MTMPTADWLSMVLLGIFGTGHCIGMCGPLVVAFPGRHRRLWPHIVYHLGRVSVYTVIGGLLGGAGLVVAALTAGDPVQRVQVLGRVQVLLSLAAGGGLIYMALAQLGLLRLSERLTVAAPQGQFGFGAMIAAARRWPPAAGMLALGAVNGMLPCGLSYAAFMRAAAGEGILEGMTLCAAFGIGTLPGLLLLGTGTAHLLRRYRRQADILSGMIMAAMGVMLLVKALGVVFL
ncbi:MAG: sulfite exporter TauE/SafE family protein [Pseudomonadota bacterium]